MAVKMVHFGILIIVYMLAVISSVCDADNLPSISQISPKSASNDIFEETDALLSSSTINDEIIVAPQSEIHQSVYESLSTTAHERHERSASPIMNDPTTRKQEYRQNEDGDILNFETNNEVDSSGRYYDLISPTKSGYRNEDLHGEMTQSLRTGKDLGGENPFLVKGGLRLISSESPINPTTVMPMSPIATSLANQGPRQNPNPDIQDIITGIVKLLNGNVNVHANTQSTRRPIPSRINNRGPPRINEAQPIPNDYDGNLSPPTTSVRPPYPFDRPNEGPVRPFITGVPLPEQIVPSMQQNYRPGFVSQNRPPWQRPRPRPPIAANRRPVPPYKPIPPLPEYKPDDELTPLPSVEPENSTITEPPTTIIEDDIVEPEDIIDEQESNESDLESDEVQHVTITEETPPKKDILKKDKKPIKTTEKIPVPPVFVESSTEIISETPDFTNPLKSTSESTPEIQAYQHLFGSTSPSAPHGDNEIVESSIYEEPTTPIGGSNATQVVPTEVINITEASQIIMSSSQTLTTPTLSTLTTPNPLKIPPQAQNSSQNAAYHPRPGIVLDDPEFKPGGSHRPQNPLNNGMQRPKLPQVQPNLPPGYGEIFDVTLSAIQGPGGGSSGKQTVHIKPYGSFKPGSQQATQNGGGDIILSAQGDDGFVSIDGKRTYINLFGDPTDHPAGPSIAPSATHSSTIKPTQLINPGITGTGYATSETEPPAKIQPPAHRIRPRPLQPPVRIDTCIVGDDSTCDQAQNERCKTEGGVSSCHCRPGYARRKHREPCRRIVSLVMSLKVDKIYERRIVWDNLFRDPNSEPYQQLSFEAIRAMDSAMSMTPFSDEFMESKVNRIFHGDTNQGGVYVNLTLKLEENGETIRPALKNDIQRHLLGVIHRRNNNIGNSALYVDTPPGAVSNIQDLDECLSPDLNDCNTEASCSNIWGSFRCECHHGYRDPWADQPQRAGRECLTCADSFCNNRGTCSFDSNGNQVCSCAGSYYGSTCEIDGEVLGVAVGASVAAVIIIVLTLICLIMWSRRWQREHKNTIGSPVFGYMNGAQVKTPVIGQAPYQVTLEDRMRWAQIADVMAQANHYAAEPTRPSSAMYGYPTLQTIGSMNTLGTISLAGTIPMHTGTLPPVPLPRLGLNRPSGMRTLENSSSSEEEDRTDLLGRNFHVPRPKSRSNASVTSGIYYDVDYAPAGNDQLYGLSTASTANTITKTSNIPLSTYTSNNGRNSQNYYK